MEESAWSIDTLTSLRESELASLEAAEAGVKRLTALLQNLLSSGFINGVTPEITAKAHEEIHAAIAKAEGR